MILEVTEIVVRGVLLGVVYGMLAIPIALVFLATDTVDLAIGGYATIGGTVAAVAGGGLGIFLGLGAGILASGVMGLVFLILLKRGFFDPITMVLASFGLSTALSSLVLWQWGKDPFVERVFSNSLIVGSIRIDPQGLINLGVVALVLASLSCLMYYTPLGRAMRACAVSSRAAVLAGIPVINIQFLTILSGGALGAGAGILVLYTTGLDYSSGLHLALIALSAAVLAGLRSPVHVFFGGIVIGVAEALASGYLSGGLASVLPMVLILLALGTGRVGSLASAGVRP